MGPPAKKLRKRSVTSSKKQNSKLPKNRVTPLPNMNYDVLRVLFKYLKAKDLSSVICVCKTWKEAASKEISTRRSPEYVLDVFSAVEKCKEPCTEIQASQLAENLKIRPEAGLVFIKVNEEDDDKMWIPKDCFFRYLPSTCQSLMTLSAYDIVGDLKSTNDKTELAVATFLPKIPKLKMCKYDVEANNIHTYNSHFRGILSCKMFLEQFMSQSNGKSKCVILLTSNDRFNMMTYVAEYFREIYEPEKVALWGGIPTRIKNCSTSCFNENADFEHCTEDIVCSIICLSSPSLQSWSVVVPKSYMTKRALILRLEKFKEKIQLKKNSLALMSSCIARVENKQNEIEAFKEVFPKVPLVGFYGNGEFGINTLDKKRSKDVELSFSIVFLILTYD